MEIRELKPSENMHLKNIHTGDIYEGTIYLGIYDSVENYIEVSEEEYQAYLNRDVEIELDKALLGNSENVGEEVEYSIYDGIEWK